MQFLKSAEVKLRQFRNKLAPLIYRGDKCHCPVCNKSFSHFVSAGKGQARRENAVCPYCRSRERDRLNWLFLQQKLANPQQQLRFLHIAPEPCLQQHLQALVGKAYLTADLARDDVMQKMDITDIPHPDSSFDAIYCSHVLQDVPDEQQAISEFYRVLDPEGWAILNVPITPGLKHTQAIEVSTRASWDHRPNEYVRQYGLDYAERLSSAGFNVEVISAKDLVEEPLERQRMCINTEHAGTIYLVSKPR
ncbi:MAG: methyltransferase domain-containing protein [Cellvibrionaceae bacterium]|nr:methyltransferase domain-containing protein [Cellvibrionaceae bacterium]